MQGNVNSIVAALPKPYISANSTNCLFFLRVGLNAGLILQYSNKELRDSSMLCILFYSFSLARSAGHFPYLSKMVVLAPLISSLRTTLELPEITAKCSGVSPSLSLSLIGTSQLTKKLTAFSLPS